MVRFTKEFYKDLAILIIAIAALITMFMLLPACNVQVPRGAPQAQAVSADVTPVAPITAPTYKYQWDNKGDAKPEWAGYLVSAMVDTPALLSDKSDMTSFCSKWPSLNVEQRKAVVVQLIAAMTSHESSYHLTSYAVEPASAFPTPDEVTGKPVASEGLLQLSYQDQKSYKGKIKDGYCVFNWPADKALDVKDPKKSIFQAKANLQCGLLILNRQVERSGLIANDKSYWSVLRPNGKYSQTIKIKASVQGFELCK